MLTLDDIKRSVFKNRGSQCRFLITENGVGLKLYTSRGLRDHDYQQQLTYWGYGFSPMPGEKFEVDGNQLPALDKDSKQLNQKWYGFTTEVAETVSSCGRSGHLNPKAPPEVVQQRAALLDAVRDAGLDFTDSHWGNMGILNGKLVIIDTSMGIGNEV